MKPLPVLMRALCVVPLLLLLHLPVSSQGDCNVVGTLGISDATACGCGGSCFPTYCQPLGTGSCARQIVSVFLDVPPCYNGTIRAETLNCNPNASGLDIGDFCQVGFTRVDGNNNLLIDISECHAAPAGTTIPISITLSADRKDELIEYSMTCIEHDVGCAGSVPPCSMILPLSITGLSLLAGDRAVVHWIMHEITNTRDIRLMRSKDGRNWKELKCLEEMDFKVYPDRNQLIDEAPWIGSNYYRLIETKWSGESFHSPILYFLQQADEFSILTVGPNPCQDRIEMWISSRSSGWVHCHILNMDGKKLLRDKFAIHEGTDKIIMNTSDLSPGHYNISILHEGSNYHWPFVKI